MSCRGPSKCLVVPFSRGSAQKKKEKEKREREREQKSPPTPQTKKKEERKRGNQRTLFESVLAYKTAATGTTFDGGKKVQKKKGRKEGIKG